MDQLKMVGFFTGEIFHEGLMYKVSRPTGPGIINKARKREVINHVLGSLEPSSFFRKIIEIC